MWKEINEWNISGGEGEKKVIYVSIFGYTPSSLGDLEGGKNVQMTFKLTVVSDHRSNILYAIKLRNYCLSKIRVNIVLGSKTWSIINPYFRIDLKCIDSFKQKMTMYRFF